MIAAGKERGAKVDLPSGMSNRFRRDTFLRPRNGGEDRQPERGEASPPPQILIRVLLAFFFVFDFPAFTLQLALDPATSRFVGSPVFALMTFAGNVFVAILILSSHNVRRLAKRSWPVWAMTGLGLVSALWSINPRATVAVTFRDAGAFYLAIAIASLMPQFQSIRFAIRTMVLGCFLSLIWVFVFPEVALHHETDLIQTVHAGLWRGVFSHKQGLGVFAGLTTGLLIVYRTLIFPPVILIGAIGCSLTCLIGSGSATGFITMVMGVLIFYSSRSVILAPITARKGRLLALIAAFLVFGFGFKFGLLDPVIHLLGKSSDLTGRADLWPIEIANFNATGKSWLGGGLGSGLALDISEWSIDNGYLDMIIDFGYLISPIFFCICAIVTIKSATLLLTSPREMAAVNIFPFGIWAMILIDNITESSFMTKSYTSILAIIAIGLLFREQSQTATDSRQALRPRSPRWAAPSGGARTLGFRSSKNAV